MRWLTGASLACGLLLMPAQALAEQSAEDPAKPEETDFIGTVCDLISTHADAHGLPRDFLARLIWKESRFDPDAVSPAGAEGIAQFMPGTAAMRGLADPFAPEQAIPASARYLGELRRRFGNLGLAAAAYNSGESRVTRWLSSGGFLPLETENYVLDIMGEPADSFSDRAHAGTVQPLAAGVTFAAACRNLPAAEPIMIAMATTARQPWGVQVAGNARRAAALRQWQRVKGRHDALLAEYEPVVSRVRSARGRRGIYAVRIGADDRVEADRICDALRRAGGACIVMRNR